MNCSTSSGITIGAVISGAASWTAVEAYGRAKRDWLAKSFRLPNGIPAHDTFHRVVCRLDPEAFQRSFADWIAVLAECGVGSRRTLPSAGKTTRRSGRRGRGLGLGHSSKCRMSSSKPIR